MYPPIVAPFARDIAHFRRYNILVRIAFATFAALIPPLVSDGCAHRPTASTIAPALTTHRNTTPPALAAQAPPVSFFGVRDTARRVCYICDANGSMMLAFDRLRFEVASSIANLVPEQSFAIMFMHQRGYWGITEGQWFPANPEKKRKAESYMHGITTLTADTDPMPALNAAARLQPDVIYLLTDGDFGRGGNERVIDFCKKRFAGTKTRINTIAIVHKDEFGNIPSPFEYPIVTALEAIAKNTGGKFKYVPEDDLRDR